MSLPKLIAFSVAELVISISGTYVIGSYIVKKRSDPVVVAYTVNPTITSTPTVDSSTDTTLSAPDDGQVEGAKSQRPTDVPNKKTDFGTLLSPTPTLVGVTNTPSPTPTSDNSSSVTNTPTPTPTTQQSLFATSTPTPTLTPLPTATNTPTPTIAATSTVTPTTSAPEPSGTSIFATVTPTITPTDIPSGFGTLLTLSATPTSVLSPTPSPVFVGDETIKLALSVSTMNQSKDKLNGPRNNAEIAALISKVKDLGSTHVGIETPYDSPVGTDVDALTYTKAWVDEARKQNLKVWHRHMPIKFEGIYNQPKATDPADGYPDKYITQVSNYIKENKELFQEGDIFTPIPEPQNSGVDGMNSNNHLCYDGQHQQWGPCMFGSVDSFNKWLRDIVTSSRNALTDIGLGSDKVRVVCCGFDGYMTWGDNNPDHQGQSFLTSDTITTLGAISIDHYPAANATMAQDLKEFRDKWPGVDLWVSETGSVPEMIGTSTVQEVTKMILDGIKENLNIIKGFQWFQLGPARDESLVHDDGNGGFVPSEQYDEVQTFYGLHN